MKVYTKKDEMDSVLTEKHIPNIKLPDNIKVGEEFEIEITVGDKVPHPNTIEHHIKWIQLFAEIKGRTYNPVHIATFNLGPTFAEPKLKVKIKLEKSSNIIAMTYCNLHGLWQNSEKITL